MQNKEAVDGSNLFRESVAFPKSESTFCFPHFLRHSPSQLLICPPRNDAHNYVWTRHRQPSRTVIRCGGAHVDGLTNCGTSVRYD